MRSAVCAMLLECLFIVFFLAEHLPFVYYLPFITQLACLGAAILYVNASSNIRFADQHPPAPEADIELLNEHPILWKNVAKLSLIILVIVSAMNFIGNNLGFSQDISTLIIALFEAHAVLASVMTQWTLNPANTDLMSLFFLILLGSALSKSYLALKGPNLSQKWFFISIMGLSLTTSAVVTFIWYQAMPYN